MPRVNVLNQLGEKVGTVTLNDEVYKIEPNEQVVYEVINAERAGMRQGTHKVKGRSEVRGGGKKPWRQKGTGRARQGSIRSPQWVGGGVVFGPTPRSYSYKLPRKVRRLALHSVLSQKVQENNLVVVDALSFDAPATKEFKSVLAGLNVSEKTLLILEGANSNTYLSARNIPNVKVIDDYNVNVLDVVTYDKVIITKAALSTVEEALA